MEIPFLAYFLLKIHHFYLLNTDSKSYEYSASFDVNIKVPQCIVFEKTQKSKNDVKKWSPEPSI